MEDLKRAARSGFSGYKAMTIQVCSLMWLRTIMNYQYKYGTPIRKTISILYNQGGITRFYAGLLPALIQGPVSRFGDTFANSLALGLMKNKNFPIFLKTLFASMTAGAMRIFLTPIDTLKTMSQVEGKEARRILVAKIKANGMGALYHGSVANALGTFIGHYPWFVTHNYLNKYIPISKDPFWNTIRNACIGFTCSMVSDTTSNFMRVIKTARQTAEKKSSYLTVVKGIVQKDGVHGLLFRGLGIRLFTNGIQGLLFNILWKYFDRAKNTNANSHRK